MLKKSIRIIKKISTSRTAYFFIFFGLTAFVLGIIFSPIAAFTATAAAPSPNPLDDLKNAAKAGGLIKGDEAPTLQATIGSIIGAVLAFVGVIFLILIIYGGITWMTAGGSEEKIKKAKGLIVNSIIGLVIILAAYSIVSFIFTQIGGVTS
jgi:hypothetical protein